MVLCSINYNASTGSNSASSGTQNPATGVTDVSTGQTVSATAATNTITFSAAVNLTGVLDDNTDVVHVAGTAGQRHLFRITAFNGGVSTCTSLTVAEAVGAAGLTASAWAVGGTRLNLWGDNTNHDTLDAVSWGYFLEDTASFLPSLADLPIDLAATGGLTDGPNVLSAAPGASPVLDLSTQNASGIGVAGSWKITGLQITGTSTATTQDAIFVRVTNSQCVFEDCLFNTNGSAVDVSLEVSRWVFYRCDMASGNTAGSSHIVHCNGGRAVLEFYGCVIHDGSANGLFFSSVHTHSTLIVDTCAFYGNARSSILQESSVDKTTLIVKRSVFDGDAFDGVEITGTATGPGSSAWRGSTIHNNVFMSLGRYGVANRTTAVELDTMVYVRNNAYYLNTSGERLAITPIGGEVTLSADPFVDSASHVYDRNEVAGGGLLLRDAGYPNSLP